MKILLLILLSVVICNAQWNNTNANLKGSQGSTFSQDGATNAIITIDYPHHEVHEGGHYYISGFSNLGDGDSIVFSTKTPDTAKWAHMVMNVSSTTVLSFYIYEGVTVTGTDTVVAHNNNRNYPDASTLVVINNPGISDFGTCIDSSRWGSTGGANKFGGEITRDDELILKQNTTYLWVLVSGAASNIVRYKGMWYEHTNKH